MGTRAEDGEYVSSFTGIGSAKIAKRKAVVVGIEDTLKQIKRYAASVLERSCGTFDADVCGAAKVTCEGGGEGSALQMALGPLVAMTHQPLCYNCVAWGVCNKSGI